MNFKKEPNFSAAYEVWKLVRIRHDFDLIKEAAAKKHMSVSEFIAHAAAEYADLYLHAYEKALEDVLHQLKGGRNG